MSKRLLAVGLFALVVSLPSFAFAQAPSCCQCIYFSNILCQDNPMSTVTCSDYCLSNNAGSGAVVPNAACDQSDGLCKGNPAPATSHSGLFGLSAALVLAGCAVLARRRLRHSRA